MKSAIFLKAFILSLLFLLSPSIYAVDLPNLELKGDDGKSYKLMEFLGKGKWTTVVIWGPRCPACIEEMPLIQGLYEDRDKTNIDVLGLALDFPSFGYADIEEVQQFKEDYLIEFPSLLISADIFFKLGLGSIQGTPTVMIVNPEGKLKALQLGGVPRNMIENYITQQESKRNLTAK